MLNVKVGKFPGRIVPVTLPEGSTVQTAVEAADIESGIGAADLVRGGASYFEIRVNAEVADADTELKEGDNVLLVKKLKGN